MTRLSLFLIKCYQYLFSPLFSSSCRFIPSCSSYCSDAIIRYGFLKGTWLGILRLIRCNPWNTGGYDPVP